jgi:hypothetical protein
MAVNFAKLPERILTVADRTEARRIVSRLTLRKVLKNETS